MKRPHRDRSLHLMLIGMPALLLGFVAVVYAPLEVYPLYMFSEGGRFHYPGFGFGSFMFGNIAVQIVGYYLVALIFIPLGYGHLRRRRWVRSYALALLWFWLIVGAPLAVLFLFMLLSVKELSPLLAWLIILLTLFSYLGLPFVLIRFYRSDNVRLTLEQSDARSIWIDQTPVPRLVLMLLFGFYFVFVHFPLMFRGIFPFWGRFLLNLEGMFLIDISLWILGILWFGIVKRKLWAWWGSIAYFLLLFVNSMITFLKVPYSQILSLLSFPDYEMKILQGIPLNRYHLMAAFGLPMMLTIIAIAISRKHFGNLDDQTVVC